MSTIATSRTRTWQDHFVPEASLDPAEQRALRGHLEQIDYATYAANREVVGRVLGQTDIAKFQHLAVAAAQARADWVAAALAMTEKARMLDPAQTARLTALRTAYDELTEVYEAMRRLVERGYLAYQRRP